VITFKQFFESTQPLGLIETITFKELGPIEAKVDSGNGAYNVLHGLPVEGDKFNTNVGEEIPFKTVNDKILTKPVVELININIGSGNIETRPVVEFDIEIGDKKYPATKFSIGDRKENEYKILVGKDFIEQLGGLIDVSAEGNLD